MAPQPSSHIKLQGMRKNKQYLKISKGINPKIWTQLWALKAGDTQFYLELENTYLYSKRLGGEPRTFSIQPRKSKIFIFPPFLLVGKGEGFLCFLHN